MKTPPQFRRRLALQFSLLSGAVLAVFMLSAWGLLYRSKLETVRAEMLMNIQREVAAFRMEHRGLRSGRPDRPLPPSRPSTENSALLTWILNAQGDRIQRSAGWPEPLSLEAFSSRPPTPPSLHPETARRLRPPATNRPAEPLAPDFRNVKIAGTPYLLASVHLPEFSFYTALDLHEMIEEMKNVRWAGAVALPLSLIFIAWAGWILGGQAVRPVNRLREAAESITANDLSLRLDEEAQTLEFQRLMQVFNQMLERLEAGFLQASRFSADAAHELKTPLTILQQELEQALACSTVDMDTQRTYASLLEEVQRIKSITSQLLLLAHADAGQLKPGSQSIDLGLMLEELAEDTRVLAPELELQTQIEHGVTVHADPDLLMRLLRNLTDNAVKYNLPQGWIRISLRSEQSQALVEISNAGQPIPVSDHEKIFERFYRRDPSRAQSAEGSGLGLSLSREIARVHQGSLSITEAGPQEVRFSLSLPLSRQEEQHAS